MTDTELREQVRARYAEAASAVRGAAARGEPLQMVDPDQCCSGATGVRSPYYSADEHEALPDEAVAASLGCGNPLVVADLVPGERVLDLGSGGGIDVLLSARRVGPTGFVYGLDMTDEMLELARENATRAGVENVAFLKGCMEQIPLPDGSVDVVISNCVVNLSTDKPAVLREVFRVLVPGGRIGFSDIVAEDDLTPEQRAERGSFVGCIAGALSQAEYLAGLTAAGFVDPTITFTFEAEPGLYSAVIRARRTPHPADDEARRHAALGCLSGC
jgi:ubiquinone/menaquinone biosynthesis C-methylase UbiE